MTWRLSRPAIAEALVQPDTDEGRKKAREILLEMRQLLDDLPYGGSGLSETREYRRMIDEELAKLPAK